MGMTLLRMYPYVCPRCSTRSSRYLPEPPSAYGVQHGPPGPDGWVPLLAPRQKNHRISQSYAMMGNSTAQPDTIQNLPPTTHADTSIWALASSLTLCRSEISLFAELPVPRSHRLQRLLHHPGST